MKYAATLLAGTGLFSLLAQQPEAPAVFTAEQAKAGRIAYERTCGQCHTPTLTGRKSDPGELPPISSLSESWQKFIGPRGLVSPLVGKVFIERWGHKTAGQLVDRFQETVDDPYLKFDGLSEEDTVNITAYVLQVNGAKAGNTPLTRATSALVSSVTR
jgi:hypothetical protein